MLAGLLQIVQLGSLPMRLESLDMGILIRSILKRIRRRWGDSAEVSVAGLPPCYGDRALIGELFSSLLGNAVEYLDRERRGSIGVRGSVVGEESIYIVEDNGIGIPSEHLDGVFRVFHQVNPDRSSGAGVGLTAARCIVQRHGGRLWVESELGRGSRFYAALAKA
jgi:signal transduction histidine kinase